MGILNKRTVSTGGLRINGSSVRMGIEVHSSRTYDISRPEVRENVLSASNDDGYEDRRQIGKLHSDIGLVAGQIRRALKEGYSVTAETESSGQTEFIKKGPFVFGLSERQEWRSMGVVGLKGMLGLKEPGPEPSEGAPTLPFHPL